MSSKTEVFTFFLLLGILLLLSLEPKKPDPPKVYSDEILQLKEINKTLEGIKEEINKKHKMEFEKINQHLKEIKWETKEIRENLPD